MSAHTAAATITDRFTGTELFDGSFRSLAAAMSALHNDLEHWTGTHVLVRDNAASTNGMTGQKAFDVVRVVEGQNVEVVANAYVDIA